MTTFTLPAGCRMRITASMEPTPADRHRWSMALYPAESGPDAEPRANYGSRIGRGETHRIDAAACVSDSRCEIRSTHETDQGWAPDVAEVTLDTPDDLSISFHRPASGEAADDLQGCVLAIQFSPAVRVG
jgi:hypothetical protein